MKGPMRLVTTAMQIAAEQFQREGYTTTLELGPTHVSVKVVKKPQKQGQTTVPFETLTNMAQGRVESTLRSPAMQKAVNDMFEGMLRERNK